MWVFHVLPGPNNASAVWAAQRVPDDHVAVVANGLTIRQMDLEDKDNFLASENVIQAAVDAGFFDPNAGKPFDFTAAYVRSALFVVCHSFALSGSYGA